MGRWKESNSSYKGSHMQGHRSIKLHGVLRKLGLHRVGLGFDHHRDRGVSSGTGGAYERSTCLRMAHLEEKQEKEKGGPSAEESRLYPVSKGESNT